MQCSSCGQLLQSGWRLCPVCQQSTGISDESSVGMPLKLAIALFGAAIGYTFGDALGAVVGIAVGMTAVAMISGGVMGP